MNQNDVNHENTSTLKPRNNNPFNNRIPAIEKMILSPSVVNPIVKSPCNNKIPARKNKIFGPFKFVKPRVLSEFHDQADHVKN
jgi:hypothetical protein